MKVPNITRRAAAAAPRHARPRLTETVAEPTRLGDEVRAILGLPVREALAEAGMAESSSDGVDAR
jgi:hypothetical protein